MIIKLDAKEQDEKNQRRKYILFYYNQVQSINYSVKNSARFHSTIIKLAVLKLIFVCHSSSLNPKWIFITQNLKKLKNRSELNSKLISSMSYIFHRW